MAASVLIVDTHPIVRAGLARVVEAADDFAVCAQVGDARDAIGLALRLRPDLILTDLLLERGSGLGVIKELVGHGYAGGIVVFSDCDESLYAERAIRAGAHGYLHKSAPTRRILDTLARVARGAIVVSDRVNAMLLGRLAGRGGDDEDQALESLSDRELEVFELLGRGFGSAEIATHLGISAKTVETYRAHLKRKLGHATNGGLTKHAVIHADRRRPPVELCNAYP